MRDPSQYFRPGTNDSVIWQSVYDQDEYGVALAGVVGKTVLDIGAHIGSFSARCLDFGASLVVSAEPVAATADIHRKIMSTDLLAGRAVLFQGAAWSKSGNGQISRCQSPEGQTSGDTMVLLGGNEEPCRLFAFDSLLTTVAPDFVKLDCEGAEYIVLKTVDRGPDLWWVEFHTVRQCAAELTSILNRFKKAGYSATLLKEYPFHGHQVYKFVRE